jgi:hypothetical protein
MATWISRYEVHRIDDPSTGRTLCFMVFLGSRAAGWKRFDRSQVPDFTGHTAWFEVERTHKGAWRFLRHVDASAPA